MEYEEDVCPEWLKYVKEQGKLSRFQLRLAAKSQVSEKHYQPSKIVSCIC